MRVAFDLDGTVFKHPKFFRAVAQGLKDAGHHIGILTERKDKKRAESLKQLNEDKFPDIDFFFDRSDDEVHQPAAKWKKAQCQKHGIDYLFDDFDSDSMHILLPENIEAKDG